jgi:hypothetical protein
VGNTTPSHYLDVVLQARLQSIIRREHPSLLFYKFGVVGAMLVPSDGTLESDHDRIPLLILRQADDIGRFDLSQKWRNASDFFFTDSSEDLSDLVTLLMDKRTDADTSVHFRFTGGSNGQQRCEPHRRRCQRVRRAVRCV